MLHLHLWKKKSVFETSKGYSLVDEASKKKNTDKSRSASVITTGNKKPGVPHSGSVSGGERKNPWRDPNFFPGKNGRGKPSGVESE